jgi:hypothetical protein
MCSAAAQAAAGEMGRHARGKMRDATAAKMRGASAAKMRGASAEMSAAAATAEMAAAATTVSTATATATTPRSARRRRQTQRETNRGHDRRNFPHFVKSFSGGSAKPTQDRPVRSCAFEPAMLQCTDVCRSAPSTAPAPNQSGRTADDMCAIGQVR